MAMDTHNHNKDEICDVCGDIGYNEVVFTCSTCRTAHEHIYCMSVHYLENIPESWVCDSCKENTKLVEQSEHDQFQPKTQTHSEISNVIIASVVGQQQQLHQASTDSQDMATRRTSVFQREQRRATRAFNGCSRTPSSKAKIANLMRDQPSTQRQCVRLPTPPVTVSSRSLLSQGGDWENKLPTINPFVYEGPYSSEADEIEYLNKTLHIWRGLGEFPIEGESGFSDPRQGFTLGLQDFRKAFTRLTVSFGRMGDELNRLYLNYAPREELARAQASLVRANRLLEEAKVELESCQVSSRAEIDGLKVELGEAKSQLRDAKYLADEFKKTEEFVVMQNNIMECGVNWSVQQALIEHPGIDFGFLQIRFKAECDAPDNDSDDMGVDPSATNGYDEMTLTGE